MRIDFHLLKNIQHENDSWSVKKMFHFKHKLNAFSSQFLLIKFIVADVFFFDFDQEIGDNLTPVIIPNFEVPFEVLACETSVTICHIQLEWA